MVLSNATKMKKQTSKQKEQRTMKKFMSKAKAKVTLSCRAVALSSLLLLGVGVHHAQPNNT
jgi:hypothetical protein